MKVNITSTSSFYDENLLIEVDTIEDAIKYLHEHPEELKKLTEERYPDNFVLTKSPGYDFDYQLEIYDTWRE